jgi:hypothetical protein
LLLQSQPLAKAVSTHAPKRPQMPLSAGSGLIAGGSDVLNPSA